MYLYSLRGRNYNIVLTHKDKISGKEFRGLCDEVEKLEMPYYTMGDESLYDVPEVVHHLITRHGFRKAVYQSCITAD